MNIESKCERCLEGRLKSWEELDEDEREVVRRLDAAGYSLTERQRQHTWCTRCWHECEKQNSRI